MDLKNRIFLTIVIIILLVSIISFNCTADNILSIGYNNNKGIYLDELYTTNNIKDYNITVGLKHLKLTNSNFNQLMLNENGPSVPLIYLNKEFKYFTGETAVLFLNENNNRKLFIHRISNNSIINNLEIGVSEAVIAFNKINPLYYLPQPYIPYYLTKKITGINSEYNNYDDSYIGIDFNYRNNYFELYGEMLIDEFPYQSWATNPDKRAHLIGIEIPIYNKYYANIEYSNVYAGVYEHRYEENNYKYNNEYLGHDYGPDTVEYDFGVGYKNSNNKIVLSYSNIKKGPNDMNGNKNVGYGGILLNKVIEEINEYNFEYKFNNKNVTYNIKLNYAVNETNNIDYYQIVLNSKICF